MAEKHDTVRGLVLAGGGAKGSYQVGVYQALMELGWLPDVITGASVGSLNAALFVMGKVNEAADLWRSLDNHGVLELPEGKTPEELRAALEKIDKNGENLQKIPVSMVAQTTINREIFDICSKIIKKQCTNAKIFGTICNATDERQAEARLLAGKSDIMIVIGDRKSSNTKRLYTVFL